MPTIVASPVIRKNSVRQDSGADVTLLRRNWVLIFAEHSAWRRHLAVKGVGVGRPRGTTFSEAVWAGPHVQGFHRTRAVRLRRPAFVNPENQFGVRDGVRNGAPPCGAGLASDLVQFPRCQDCC